MSKKKAITEGLAGLMATPAATDRKRAAEPQATPAQTPARGNYKTVCYSLPPDIADRIRAQAAAERRTIGAVVAQALADYLAAHGAK